MPSRKKPGARKRAARKTSARPRTRAHAAGNPGSVQSARGNVPAAPGETAGVDTAGESAESVARSARGER